MPVNYTEGAITFGVGQQYRDSYTHSWKPFAEVGALYSIPFGLGPMAEGGIRGGVLGRDHLTIYARYSRNQQQVAQQNYTVGIRYDNNF